MDKKMLFGFAAGVLVTVGVLVSLPDVQLSAAQATTQQASVVADRACRGGLSESSSEGLPRAGCLPLNPANGRDV